MSHVYGIVLVAIACGFCFGFAYGYWAGRQHGAEHERTDRNDARMEAWRNRQPAQSIHISDNRDQSIHTTTVHQYAPPTPASDPARRQLPRGHR